MENRIPIDDLFKEGLSGGKEQLNLGAWANMERMLDGKNPYADDEKKSKRRFLPFLLLGLLLAGIVSVGTIFKKHHSDKDLVKTQETTSGQKLYVQDKAEVAIEETKPTSSEHTSNKEQVEPSESQSNRLNSSMQKTKYSVVSNVKNQLNSSRNNAKNDSRNNFNKTNNNLINNDLGHASKTNGLNSSTLPNEATSDLNSKEAESLASNSNLSEESKISEKIQSKQKHKSKQAYDTIPTIQVSQKINRKRDGSIKSIAYDTISYGKTIVEKEEAIIESPKEEPTKTVVERKHTNPRLVNLSKEQELQANESKPLPINAETPEISSSSTQSVAKINEKVATSTETKYNSSFMDDVRNYAKSSYEKLQVLSFKLFSKKILLIPGMNVGVNASLFDPKHNYGGFHAGATIMKPMGEYMSLHSELKFFFKNNGGYTINDLQTSITNTNTDNLSMTNQGKTIYSYTIDSSSKIYNFKRAMSLELPLLAQFNYRSFSVYGGANIAYAFKLKVNETNSAKNGATLHIDTLDNATPFYFPENQSRKYARTDFGARFGIGYMLGASYSFNPNLYLDLRLAQNVWDNTKTSAAREVSSGFFKVPSIQFSIGYRFKKYSQGE